MFLNFWLTTRERHCHLLGKSSQFSKRRRARRRFASARTKARLNARRGQAGWVQQKLLLVKRKERSKQPLKALKAEPWYRAALPRCQLPAAAPPRRGARGQEEARGWIASAPAAKGKSFLKSLPWVSTSHVKALHSSSSLVWEEEKSELHEGVSRQA